MNPTTAQKTARLTSADPFCFVIVGAPGTGKSSAIRLQLAQLPARRLVFDPMNEYGRDAGELVSLATMQRRLVAAGPGPFSLVHRPGTDDAKPLKAKFDAWCRLAFAAGNLVAVVDEAADVTSPNRYEIPPGWSQLMRQFRHRSIQIIAATQRPADIDKRLWSFATRIRTGRLNFSNDQRELAGVLNVELAEVAGLIERQWIERDMRTGEVRRGAMEWKRGRPLDVPRAAPGAALVEKKPATAPRLNARGRMGG